jgi:DNA-binding transcriptional ArsR family regulator
MIEICNLCKLLSNPLRLDMLVRVYSASDGANVGVLADELGRSGIGQSGVSQYLKQLAEAGFLSVERTGRYVICSGEPEKASPVYKLQMVLARIFAASCELDWQKPLLTTINAFAHHVRIRILQSLAACPRCGFEELAKATDLPFATLRRQLGLLIAAQVVAACEASDGSRIYELGKPSAPLARTLLALALQPQSPS